MNRKANLEKARLRGGRLTSQRKLIYSIVSRSDGHLDADQIYTEAKSARPRISLSTVYRALARFKEMGLIAEHDLGQGHHHYETSHSENHHHFVCNRCGLVLEFEYALSRQVKMNVPALKGFKVTSAEVNMKGMCRKCGGK
jgi:Fe2+ or Zn2+ uptake regulation protein